ncbi:pyridoxal phosphate phosphatase PHOSPHO2-like [Cydia pomonella]|uniref:pyridoxal phosphate phosphatase PHOSPHO2-like n=1 Tax=Cydia pomonella TaxID=82600 RepID=UPI002ADD3DF2|nr:pyridoxal phosphate phosphatase PHOSPHO2-like [Cydia pomonella]
MLRAPYISPALEPHHSLHAFTALCARDKMASLAVFDFDRTIVDNDSDAVVIEKLREKQPPPEWESENRDWTPYMSDVFEHAYSAGLRESDVLSAIASMKATPGCIHMLKALHKAGWHIVLLTDANTVFVQHWLSTHQLEDCITAVITNRAFWDQGRLYIEPCMRQTACSRCPTNLCKSLALAQWCARHQYSAICYAGDGRNDYCPATNLPAHATVFPRRGYPLDDLIKKNLSSSTPHIKAKVVPWDSCDTILEELIQA